MARKCPRCGEYFDGDGAIRYGTLFRSGVTYCSERCRDEAEASEAAKKEAKEAKKAAKREAEVEEYESDTGSSSSSSGSGFANSIMGNVIAGIVLILLLIVVIGVIFSKNEDANDPAVKMAKWEEHLEKRRAAFAEGLSEEGVEERGLKNYTWEEWQARNQKGQAKASGTSSAEKVDDRSLRDLWSEHQKKRRDYINAGHSGKDADKVGLYDLGFEEFKLSYKNIKYRSLEEIKQSSAVPDSSVVAPEKPAAQADVVPEKPLVKPTRPIAKPEKPMAKTTKPVAPVAVAPAKPKVGQAKTVAPKTEGPTVSADETQDGTVRKTPSKDSKGIVTTVQGKGKTEDAALRYAIRQAVFRTVGTWVGSKTLMDENKDALKAQMATVTEDDVSKFEVLETQQQDDGLVLKVKVYVSKKKIAPKFVTIFPDVFGND